MPEATVEFIRCECGAEWRHSINMLDNRPIWMPPKAKRGAPCQHRPGQAEALIDGDWIKVTTRSDAESPTDGNGSKDASGGSR